MSRVNRTLDAFLDYARAYPGCLLTLAPADVHAMRSAMAAACHSNGQDDAPESQEFMLTLDQRTFN